MSSITTDPPQPYTTGSVISIDGTTIGYRQFGQGPGIILVHGGMMTSKNFTKLAIALSDTYTVYVPDRRGRGLSGRHGNSYGLTRECEDIQALINKTDSHNIFGLSSGAIVALQTALTVAAIHKVALYEPPLLVNSFKPVAWKARYERELAKGKLAAAMVSIIKGTADSWSIGMLPRFILVPLMKIAIKGEARQAKDDDIPLKALIPTMHFDSQLVIETEGKLESFKVLKAQVLLLGGNRSASYLGVILDVLHKTLPHPCRVEFPGTGHLAADNDGKPELVATELKRFFGESDNT
jgi:pimeloyl-ACP methyl ester carboxylesterase